MAHRRLSLVLTLLAATAPSGQAAEQSPAVLAAGDLGARTVSYVYEAHATPPAGTKVLELWMPLPREEDQTLLALSLSGYGAGDGGEPALGRSRRVRAHRSHRDRELDADRDGRASRGPRRASPQSRAWSATPDARVYAAQLDAGAACGCR